MSIACDIVKKTGLEKDALFFFVLLILEAETAKLIDGKDKKERTKGSNLGKFCTL